MGEAEWVGAPERGVAPPVRSGAPVLSPGLARLLNVALIDPTFGERFVESPLMAARWVYGGVGAAGEVFGATLPDPALRLTLPALSAPDWSILGHMPRTASVAEAARELRRLAALAALAAAAALGHDEAAAPTELTEPVRLPLGGHGAYRTPASHEGELAGAA
jgi:hypothetical protein